MSSDATGPQPRGTVHGGPPARRVRWLAGDCGSGEGATEIVLCSILWSSTDVVALVLPVVTEAAAPQHRAAVARRRLTLLTGECPCGTRIVVKGQKRRRASIRHRPGCRAGAVA